MLFKLLHMWTRDIILQARSFTLNTISCIYHIWIYGNVSKTIVDALGGLFYLIKIPENQNKQNSSNVCSLSMSESK